MNKWIQKAYAILMTCLCLFQYVGSLTQVVSADTTSADGNVGVTLRGADLNADGTQLTLKYSAQTAKDSLHFCAVVTGGSLTDGDQGTLKDSQGQEIGDYYTNVDSDKGTSKVNLNIEGGKKIDDATLTLPLSNAPDKVTVTDDSDASNTVTATKPQAAAAPVNLNDYVPDGQPIAKITAFSFKDKDGKDIEPVNGTYELPPDAQARYEYQFAVPDQLKDNHQVQNGDYFTFDLPAGVKADDGQGPLDGDPSLGSFTVRNGNQVTITLNQNAVGNTDIKGTFVHTESAKNVTETGLQSFTTPVKDSRNVTAVDLEQQTDKDVTKTGTPVNSKTGGAENAKQISWDVTFNKSQKLLTNASITDPLQDGLSLNADAPVVVRDITTKETLSAGSDYTFDRDADNKVTLKGNYAKTGDVFTVTYLTDIDEDKIPDDGGSLSFTNTATLHDGDQNPSASSAVTVNYGRLLDKSGQKAIRDGQRFTWFVNFNYGEKTVKAGTKVTDKVAVTPQKYLPGTLRVYYVDFDANGQPITTSDQVDPSLYTVNFEQNGDFPKFTLTWNQSIKRAVQISYDTQATVPLADQNDNQILADPKNPIVGLNIGNEAGTGDTNVPVTVTGSQQELQKSLTGTNYYTKTNDWKITVNAGEQLFNFFEVSDKLPDALSLKGTPEVFDESTQQQLILGKDFLVTGTNQQNDGFRLIFIGAYQKTSDKFTISYHTTFDSEKITTGVQVENHADSFWVDGTGDKHHNHQVVPFGPGDKFLHDASKSGQYDPQTKQIKWTVGVNYNQRQLQDARVTDTIPEGQTYVPGSVHVFRGSIDGTIRSDSGDNAIQSKEDDWVNPTDYTVHYDEKTRTLNVDLPHDNGVYFVEFDTSLAGQLVDTTSYTNTAAFVNGGEHHDVTGTVTVDHGGDYIDKSGQKDGSVVDWSVDVNPSQSTLSDVKVVDIPSRNQFVDVNSVAVYEMMPNSEGKNTVYRKAVAGADYTVSVVTDYQNTGAQVLIVKFNKTINRAYRVDYEAKINSSADQATLSNQVSIIADHVTKTYQQKTATVIIDHDGGSASGEVGPNLRFKLTKVDGDNPSVPLAGVGFELFMAKKSGQNNPDGSPVYVKDGEVIRKGTTGDDGTLSWSNLKPGEYILQEDLSTTPEGYIAGAYAKGKHITIKANGEKDADGNLVDNQTIANNEYHGEVTLKKTALHTGERVKGATYELYRVSADGQATDTNRSGTTTDDGEFSLWNLAPGDYYLVETKAPAGYLLNKEKYSFTIARDKMANLFQTVNATDAKWRGSVEVTKRDFDQMDIALPGAEFKLYNDADEIQAIVMTGGNGVARVNGLLPGKYYFKEVEAPTGYKLNSDKKYYVNVVQTGSSEPSRQGDTVLPAGAKATVYDEEKPGSAILLKLDGFTKEGLAGAEFNLYSTQTGTLLRHGLTTDSNGKLQIPNLVPGGYYLVETKTPAGYILPAIQQQFHFTVVFNQQEGQAVEVKALNTPYLGRLQLTKENKQNGAAVANAVYGLFNTKGVQTRTLTTDAQGNAVAEYLEPGAYTLRELKAPAGFSLNATTYHVTIGKKTNGDMVHMLVFDDIQGNVQLTKRDAQNQQPVVGAVYNLYAADGKLVKQHLATSQSGNIKVTDLVPGDYYFREIQAPTGYDLNTAQVPVVVALNQPNKTALVTTDDQETKGGVVLSKTDATSGQVLPGAHFALYETDGTLVRSGLTTSANGQLVVNDLTPGDYYFRETQAPNGYTLNANNHYAFTVDFNQQQVARVHVTNKQSVGGVRLVKSDAATGELLAGAQFSLYREDGTLVRSNLNTDVNGEVVVLGLLPGQYYFVETKAPAGYMLNEQNSTPFTIGLGQQSLVQVDVTNAPQPPLPDTFGPEPPAPGNRTPGNPPLPDTFGNNDNPPLPDTYGSNQRPATHRKARAGKHQRLLQKVFPQTGDSVSYGLIVAGLILLALETTLLYLRRKHRA